MEATKIEKYQQGKINSKLTIKPYTEQNTPNMGLEDYDMVVFEGVYHEEPIGCIEINGVRRYITGLNEFAPEVKNLPEEEREAKIKEIRRTVVELEKSLASNVIKEDDEDFWDKVKLLSPNNSAFWDNILIRVSNDPVFLEPSIDPYDLIKLKAIEAGSFSIVAPSLEHARKHQGYKFYLDKYEDTVSLRTEVKKLRNKALAELEKMFNGNPTKLFLVAKCIDPNSYQYKKSTPNDVIYDNMDKYINGETVDKDKKKTAQTFIDVCKLDMELLKIKAYIKDANFFKIISTKPDGHIYYLKTNSLLGKNVSDVILYLRDPLNQDVLTEMTIAVENYWKN